MTTSNHSTLDQLRLYTTIVADTSDFHVLEKFRTQDGTTNPSHILAASKKPIYAAILQEGVKYGLEQAQDLGAQIEHALLGVLVGFGTEILKHLPGRVSTEVDAIHSFNQDATIRMAQEIIRLYERRGVSRKRVLIKIASTWEGFQACNVLETQGIHCNMTLIFSLPQAILAAESNATLISPFVGRSMDWFQKMNPGKDYSGPKDPGVQLVKEILKYYEENSIKTEIMAASLRNIDECVHLAGVDLMTINVGLLAELVQADYPVRKQLQRKSARITGVSPKRGARYITSESSFRMDLFLDHMATDKITESLRIFLKDGAEMKEVLESMILAASNNNRDSI